MTEKKLRVPESARESLAFLAALVAIEAPAKQGHARAAYIQWKTIHQIRAVLDDVGFNWRSVQQHRFALCRDARKGKIFEVHDDDNR